MLRDRLTAAVGDHYLIEGELGRGGMAAVFRALDLRLNRRVAIKVLPPEFAFNPAVRSRFLREAQLAAQLAHQRIVPIYSVDERDGLVYFVMAFVDGESVARLLERHGPLPIDRVRAIVAEVADALEYAHRQGVVHRDIKPDNILVDGGGHALVTDFGIARAAAEESRLTVTGMAVGTPAYMSPEQAMGEREVDGRSDIYSLGIVAYQMLAGETPFHAANTPAMLMKHVSEPPAPVSQRRRDIPRALAIAVDRALAKRPEDRWTSAAELRDAVLERGTAAGYLPPPPPPPSPASPPAALRLDRAPWEFDAVPRAGRQHHLPESRRPEPRDARDAVPFAPRMPVYAAPPEGLTRREQKRWLREQRRAMREGFLAGTMLDENGRDRIGAKIAKFRRRLATYFGVGFMLFIINASTGGDPWFIFPVLAFMVALVAQLGSLWGDGVPMRKVFFGATRPEPPFSTGSSAPLSFVPPLEPRAPAGRLAPLSFPAGGHRSAPQAPGAATPQDPALGLAPPEILSGAHGPTIRKAAGSRQVIGEVLARLDSNERALLPRDLEDTVNALVDRVVSVGITLHRLDTDANGATLGSLDQRLAALKRESPSAEQERRITLLERQRATLRDLLDRRAALLGQMESAALALENLKLDLVRFRSAGVTSALEDVTSATREARAVSRDIGHLLDAQDEVRKL